jgi:catechol 2,3-dioxygenase-like lactoylglutathione lyase family enzyme
MSHKGFSHVDLSISDLDKIREFYENVSEIQATNCRPNQDQAACAFDTSFFDTGATS